MQQVVSCCHRFPVRGEVCTGMPLDEGDNTPFASAVGWHYDLVDEWIFGHEMSRDRDRGQG